MVEFKSNGSVLYNRIDGLDNNESGLYPSSDEESQRDVNNEESVYKWSLIVDDETEHFMILVIITLVVFTSITIVGIIKFNSSVKIDNLFYLILLTPILLLSIITVSCLICRKRRVSFKRFSKVFKKNKIAHIFKV